MGERTGGHHLDTGQGPVTLDPPEGDRTSLRELAWRIYRGHHDSCSWCSNRVRRCTDGDRLWYEFVSS